MAQEGQAEVERASGKWHAGAENPWFDAELQKIDAPRREEQPVHLGAPQKGAPPVALAFKLVDKLLG